MQLDVHRNTMRAEVGKDLQMSFVPTFLLNQGHLEPAAQDHVQMAFGYLQGWGYIVHGDIKTLFEQQWPALTALHKADQLPSWSEYPSLYYSIKKEKKTKQKNPKQIRKTKRSHFRILN